MLQAATAAFAPLDSSDLSAFSRGFLISGNPAGTLPALFPVSDIGMIDPLRCPASVNDLLDLQKWFSLVRLSMQTQSMLINAK
jgi:hypothetical protein